MNVLKKVIIAVGLIAALIICITILTIRKTDSSHKSPKSIDNQNSITITDTHKATTSTTAISKKYSQTKSQTVESYDKSDSLSPEPQPEPVPPQQQPEPQPEPVPQPQPVPVPPSDVQTEFQAEILRLVNNERRSAGVPELTGDTLLNQAAQIRASETVVNFSHTRPNGQSCFSVFDELGISAMTKGENIAAGQSAAADVMNQWMNSEGHRANILNPGFTSLGVGFVQTSSGYKYYWTQVFAG